MRITWQTAERAAVTFSLADPVAAEAAVSAARAAADAAGLGYTLRRGVGSWAGTVEVAATLEVVGIGDVPATMYRTLAPVLAALWATGCEAIQVEAWGSDGYRCAEVRP